MKNLLHALALLLFGTEPAGEPSDFETIEREKEYTPWEVVLSYACGILIGILLCFVAGL